VRAALPEVAVVAFHLLFTGGAISAAALLVVDQACVVSWRRF